MNNTDKIVIAFLSGAAIGALVTHKLVSARYEKESEDEIEEIRKYYKNLVDRKREERANHVNVTANVITTEKNAFPDTSVNNDEYKTNQYNDILNNMNYISSEKGGKDIVARMYVIPPEEFGELYNYDTVSLTFYADGVLADECDEPIDNIDELIGRESLTHFGQYEDDSVFVRNDILECDYEILRDERKFSELQLYPEE